LIQKTRVAVEDLKTLSHDLSESLDMTAIEEPELAALTRVVENGLHLIGESLQDLYARAARFEQAVKKTEQAIKERSAPST
jgi:hypothetical protein